MPEVERVLVVCPDSLSDLVASTPVFAALREHRPVAMVSAVVDKTYEDILLGQPGVDKLLVHDSRKGHRGVRGSIAFLRTLRANEWDIAIDLRRRGGSDLMVRTSRAPIRIRAPRVGACASFLISTRIIRFFARRTRTETFLACLDRLGIPCSYHAPRLSLRPEWTGAAKNALKQLGMRPGPVVGICPGAGWETKMWPVERYTELAKRVSCSGSEVLLFGSQDDRDLCTKVAAGRSGVYNLAGRLSMGELLGVISQCKVFVGNDSGPAHCACALGVATVALFGPTDGRQFVFAGGRIIQRTVPCGPCSTRGSRRCPTGDHACMVGIPVEEVLGAVVQVLPPPKEPEVQTMQW